MYTCGYSRGHLIPIIHPDMTELYELPTRISAGVGHHPCFLTFMIMNAIDCKIANFSQGISKSISQYQFNY